MDAQTRYAKPGSEHIEEYTVGPAHTLSLDIVKEGNGKQQLFAPPGYDGRKSTYATVGKTCFHISFHTPSYLTLGESHIYGCHTFGQEFP